MAYQPLNAGTMNRRVTIQSASRADDDGGGQTTTWSGVGGWWVGISTTGGDEFRAARALQPDLTHEVRGRFRTDVTTANRLAYVANNTRRELVIHATIDTDERHEQLVCLCSEIKQP